MEFNLDFWLSVVGVALIYDGVLINLTFILLLILDREVKYYAILHLALGVLVVGLALLLGSGQTIKMIDLFEQSASYSPLVISSIVYLIIIPIGYLWYFIRPKLKKLSLQ